MSLKLSKDAIKVSFADIAIQQGTVSQPYYGYFADQPKTVEERKDLLYKYSAEESCNRQPAFQDDGVAVTDPAVEQLPNKEDLTTPPETMKFLDNPYVQAAAIGIGAYIFIKLVSE